MNWLIDTDILIEGERGNAEFVSWLESLEGVATADIIRLAFLIGVHAVKDSGKRNRGERFYRDRICALASLPNEPEDFEKAARLAGEARRNGRGAPGLADGLLAAIALRTGAQIATRNLKDFSAMGCPCENPLAQ